MVEKGRQGIGSVEVIAKEDVVEEPIVLGSGGAESSLKDALKVTRVAARGGVLGGVRTEHGVEEGIGEEELKPNRP